MKNGRQNKTIIDGKKGKREGNRNNGRKEKAKRRKEWREFEKKKKDKEDTKQTCFLPSLLDTLIFRILPQVQRLLSCSYLKTAGCLPVISLDVSLIFPSFHSTAHTDFTPATPVKWTQSANTSHCLPLRLAMYGEVDERLIDMRQTIALTICHLMAYYNT